MTPPLILSWTQGKKEEKAVHDTTIATAADANRRRNNMRGGPGNWRNGGANRGGRGGSGSTTAPPIAYSHYSCRAPPPTDLSNGIEVQRSVKRSNHDSGGRSSTTITTTILALRSTSPAVGPAHINAFVDTCLDAYNQEQRSRVNACRYMYSPVLSAAAAADDKARQGILYKRHQLSDARTFVSFFHPESRRSCPSWTSTPPGAGSLLSLAIPRN